MQESDETKKIVKKLSEHYGEGSLIVDMDGTFTWRRIECADSVKVTVDLR